MTWKRAATAAVLIPVVVSLVLWGSTAVLSLCLALVILLALFEYFALGDGIGHRAYRFWTATCALLLVYVQWLAAAVRIYGLPRGVAVYQSFGVNVNRETAYFFGFRPAPQDVFFLFVLGVAALTIWTRRPLVEALPAAGISASGLLLVAFPLTFALRLHSVGMEGPVLLLFALILIWVGDTAAYFAGRAIGKHPLAPHLSPKKTWEGAAASLVGSLLVALVFQRFLSVPLPHLLGMAAAGNLAGQGGDLLESAYKRSAGAKDSGSLLPGHGGVLDRIDALILAIPVVWYYWILIYSPRR